MIREVVEASQECIKLGVVDSHISSVRTRVERETAVRVYHDGRVGLASAVGTTDVDALTEQARASLLFDVPYPCTPESDRASSVEHPGNHHDVEGLVAFLESVLQVMRTEFPGFVFSHGMEQRRTGWRIGSDQGLDLAYGRTSTELALIAKEKGSGNIIDTFVAVDGPNLDADGVCGEFRTHLTAYSERLDPVSSGRHRVVIPGMSSPAGNGLFQILRTDLLARSYASGGSFFDGRLGGGSTGFHEALQIVDSRDAERLRICPFDMEGVVRSVPDLPLIQGGGIRSVLSSKRDAVRYGLPATGSGIGDIGALPSTGVSRLVAAPTASKLVELLDGEPGLLLWFIAGGDTTRTGDVAMPAQVVLQLDPEGRVVGRIPNCTLTGNVSQVLGADFVGVTEQRVDPFSEETFFVTHMTVHA